jgi:hypothetical protein
MSQRSNARDTSRHSIYEKSTDDLAAILVAEDPISFDDGLCLDALGQHLRAFSPEVEPLLMFCIDTNRFLRHAVQKNRSAGALRLGAHARGRELCSCRQLAG